MDYSGRIGNRNLLLEIEIMEQSLTKHEDLVAKITKEAASIFPSFGGGKADNTNPISVGVKDAPAMFALGVDISAMVRLTLQIAKYPELKAKADMFDKLTKAMEDLFMEENFGICPKDISQKKWDRCVALLAKAKAVS